METYTVVSGKNTLRACIKEQNVSMIDMSLNDMEVQVPEAFLSAAKTIAERNIGVKNVDPFMGTKALDQIQANTAPIWKMFYAFSALADSIMKVAAAFIKGKMHKEDLPKSVGTAARITQKTLQDETWDYTPCEVKMEIPYYEDVVLCSEGVEIRRCQYTATANGTERREYPWVIEIHGETISLTDIRMIDFASHFERLSIAMMLKDLTNG